jgi:hypothetical protein
MIKFSELESVLDYIIMRMRNHSMFVKSESTQRLGRLVGVPQFKIFQIELPFSQKNIHSILVYLANCSNLNESFEQISNHKASDGWIITLQSMKQSILLQNISENIKAFSVKERDLFMSSIVCKKFDSTFTQSEIFQKSIKKNQNFPKIHNNETHYYELSNIKYDDKKCIKTEIQTPNKVTLRNKCRELMKELIGGYMKEYKDGAFKNEFYEDIESRIHELYPICKNRPTLFTRNIFNEQWKEIVESDKETYASLSEPGRRYSKEN